MKKNQKQKIKTFTGKVVSLKMQGTAVVEVEREVTHPLYKKILRRSKRYKVDTNSQEVNVGDSVKIVETRPISKNKFFRIFVGDREKIERKQKNGTA